ncbi:hypothetical protein A4X06_0g2798 [Tilletia controversa]|uniref:Uncharacterized protein n=1 Tax=Tilletia controversa TaxID=13291 RepID=A0A8X7SY33_9BASI|nr:hypothetical protein A4X06_0g2798 [Tilletia controversa]
MARSQIAYARAEQVLLQAQESRTRLQLLHGQEEQGQPNEQEGEQGQFYEEEEQEQFYEEEEEEQLEKEQLEEEQEQQERLDEQEEQRLDETLKRENFPSTPSARVQQRLDASVSTPQQGRSNMFTVGYLSPSPNKRSRTSKQ